jgi:AsmA-like C-terminal region
MSDLAARNLTVACAQWGLRPTMKRTLLTRCIATFVLVSIAGLLVLAIAPLVLGVGIDDAVRRGADLLAARAGTIQIDKPLRLRAFPNVVISSGSVSIGRTGAQRGTTLTVQAPAIDIVVSEQGNRNLQAAHQAAQWLSDLIGNVGDVDKVSLRRASVNFRWADGKSLVITDCDAEISGKNTSAVAATGHCSYLGQRLKFEVSSPGRIEASPAAITGARRPVTLVVTSPLLGVIMDGELDTRGAWSVKAQTELRTPDATRLAAWLGHGWTHTGLGSGFVIRGAATWEKGVLTFGKSHVSLSDQDGVGALSLSYRDDRPLIEATAAFPALDVAPLLYVGYVPEFFPQSGVLASIRPLFAPAAAATWRGLSTSFPAASKIDTEFRLSAGRLQWRGEPIGQGAFSVSARRGVVHADFSELKIGGHSGDLQIQMDETLPNAPVTLRGRFKSTDIGELSAAAFGTPIAIGPGTSQFELTGHGATLGDVVDRASGRGSIEARDGKIHIDAFALKRLVAAPLSPAQPMPWNAVSGSSAYETLSLKFQLRNGSVALENSTLRGDGAVALISGRINFAPAELDLQVRLSPDLKLQSPVRRISDGQISKDVFSISGAWTAPMIAAYPPAPLP